MSKTLEYDYPEKLQDKIDDALIEGWTVKRQTEEKVVVQRRKKQSIFWHIMLLVFTSWWSLGLFNIMYWIRCRYLEPHTIVFEVENYQY